MKKIIFLSLIIIISFFLNGCKKDEKIFLLEDKYYTSSNLNELDIKKYNELIKNKESFAIFVYQPLCVSSYEFNKVLTEFSKTYQISFYKMSYSNLKETNLKNKIKYYPSFIIFQDGEVVDYLDANSNKDADSYKSVNSFKKWFSNYVKLKDVYINNSSDFEEVDPKMKIDAVIENITYNENRVNIYFFWGEGCPHCEVAFRFFKSIETEYGDYFTLNTFEVWHNKENLNLLDQFAIKMNEEVNSIPYIIIGDKSFVGSVSNVEKDILDAIKTGYKNSYDVYFDKK